MAAAVSTLPRADALEMPSQDVLSALSTAPQAFLQPTPTLHAAAVLAAKRFLDPLANGVSESQAHRRQEARRKRKRSTLEEEEEPILQLKQVYTDGFDVAQVWEQAKRILDAAQLEVSRGLEEVQKLRVGEAQDESAGLHQGPQKAVHFDKGVSELDADEIDDVDDLEGSLEEDEVLDDDAEDLEDEDLLEEDLEEDINMSDGDSESDEPRRPHGIYIQDPNGLNDGFFSIDDFNRQSQFLEQQDARGEDDGAVSDEDDIDWSTNPLDGGLQALGNSRNDDNGDEESESEEDGPTFGNADLDAQSDEEEDDMDDEEGMVADIPGLENANDILYSDFFDPPPQKPSKTKRMRALPKTQPPKSTAGEDVEADMQRAMSDVRRDLFDDEPSEVDDSEDGGVGAPANMSTHEKQRAKLMAEIRRLEAAAVTKRDWTLSGEARAVDRPVNSLIEEDLEFERTGKPVPVITNEVTEEIEQLIKRRILARDFDEVLKRRPELSSSSRLRKGRVEVDDTKPQQGLAEIYETEHLKATDPNYVDKLDERTKREHAEITRVWREISDKLDLLSNWNYKPKIPEANVTVVTDAPTISMEDARPSAAAGLAGRTQSALAPQEVYAPGRDSEARRGEVLLKSGNAVAKEEMSREEKLRRRRREKERAKKSAENDRAREASSSSGKLAKKSKREEKKNILDDLRKGGVKVISTKGDVTNVDGKKEKSSGLVSSASAFKL